MKLYFMLAYARSTADRPLLAEVIANLSAEGFEISTGVAESLAISPETLRVDGGYQLLNQHSIRDMRTGQS